MCNYITIMQWKYGKLKFTKSYYSCMLSCKMDPYTNVSHTIYIVVVNQLHFEFVGNLHESCKWQLPYN
jgi:hypothetical protein